MKEEAKTLRTCSCNESGNTRRRFSTKKNKETNRMMRNILTHANPEWREQRSICARVLDPRNQDRMKRRRAGVVHTNWDNLWTKWSGNQRWWEGLSDWKRFFETSEEICKKSLVTDVDKKKEGSREEIMEISKRVKNRPEVKAKWRKGKSRDYGIMSGEIR